MGMLTNFLNNISLMATAIGEDIKELRIAIINIVNDKADKTQIRTDQQIKDVISSEEYFSGTSSQFVKANGTLDSNSYALSSHTHNYVSNQVSSGSFFDGSYLQFSGDNSGNNDFIAYNDTTNAYYFNADTSRTTSSANADVYVKSLFTTSSVGINDSTPSYTLDVNGAIRATGEITSNSDVRLKTDITTIENSLNVLKQLRGVYYTRKSDKSHHLGVIADEVEKVIPSMIHIDSNSIKSVAYNEFIGLLIESSKSIYHKVESNEEKIKRLEKRIFELENM